MSDRQLRCGDGGIDFSDRWSYTHAEEDFLEHCKRTVELHPDSEWRIVVDQLNTHWHHDLCEAVARLSEVPYDPEQHKIGPERREFLMGTDKRVVVHYTPKHASWLNQIEIWFSVLVRKLLQRETFCSLAELEERILDFIAYYNRNLAHPYRWTYTGTPCCS